MDGDRLKRLTAKGEACIESYSKRAIQATFLPFVSVPVVHSLCAKMIASLSDMFDIDTANREKYSNIALGVVATPFILVPLWGAIAASAYIESVGKSYLAVLVDISVSGDCDDAAST